MIRNYILFFLVCVFIMSGWFLFVAPTRPLKKDADNAKKLAEMKKKDDSPPKDAKKDVKSEEKKKGEEEKKEKKKEKEKKNEEKQPPKKTEEKQPPAKREAPTTETLGGAEFHLTIDVTSRGGAVRKVTLNRFKEANWLGQPADGPLELVPDDEIAPSFRMYHYVDPKDPSPAFGLGEANWKIGKKEVSKLANGTSLHQIQFSTTVPGMEHIKIVKTYSLGSKDYHATLLIELQCDVGAKDESRLRYQLTGAQGLPIEGEWYASTFRNAFSGLVDQHGSLWRKLEDSLRISMRKGGDRYPEASLESTRLQYAGVANQFFASMLVVDDKQPPAKDGGVDPAKILAWTRPTHETKELRGRILKITENDVAFLDDHGVVSSFRLLPRTRQHLKDLDLVEKDRAVLNFYESPDEGKVAAWVRLGETLRPQFDDITMRVNSETVTLQPGGKVAHQFMLYHGPIKCALLAQFTGDKEVDPELVDRYAHKLYLNTLTDYPSDNWLGKVSSKVGLTYLIIYFTRLMHWLLNLLHYVFGYGLSILVLTMMVRGMMFPISRRQAMFSIKMQEMAPELKKIQERYKDDAAGKMQATQEFYRKNGINPLGSCWPVFLQMPIFFGLYFALQESIHFRLADFLWIENLAAPDMLLRWGEGIPIISSPDHSSGILGIFYLGPYLNVLPICAAALMLVVQIQTMPPPADEQQAMQQNMMRYMTIFFGLMFYKVAAGMCLYFIASSLWGIAERKLLPKKKPPSALAAGGPSATTITAKPPPPPPYIKSKNRFDKREKEKVDDTLWGRAKAWWTDVRRRAEKR